MKRLVIQEIVKMLAKSALLAAIVGVVIGVIGTSYHWNTPIAYSNAFFIAGCILIIAGASSRFAAGQEAATNRSIHAESFRDMSLGEQVSYVVDASSPLSRVILGALSGLWLILISAIAAYLL